MFERPTALLSHGGPGGDHTLYKAHFGELTRKMQLVYFDYRGNGRSARGSPDQYTLEQNVEDLEALRQYLGLERFVSIGASYGGCVAMAHAARYPNSISHLVLIATAANPSFPARAKQIVLERGTADQIGALDDLYESRLDTAEKVKRYFEVMASLYSRKYDPRVSANYALVTFSPEPLNRAFGVNGFLKELDLRPSLRHITAPTLVIAGRHDFICAPEFSEEIHRLIPHSDMRIFEESAHSIGADEPQKLVDVIAGFLVYNSRAAGEPSRTPA